MNRTCMERVASIVVLATVVTAALIAGIVGTAVGTLRFLGAIGLLSLFGLLRHGYLLISSQPSHSETFPTQSLPSPVDQSVAGVFFPVVTADHEAKFLRDIEE
jgi:hypothetical protein